MTIQSQFNIHDKPLNRTLNDIHNLDIATLLAFGIVNPLGPTLTALALHGRIESGKLLPILHIMLNPFSQSVTEIGMATMGATWFPIDSYRKFLNLSFGGCPTLLLSSVAFTQEGAVFLYANFLAHFDDGYSVLKKVRQFPGDPWKRVKQDMSDFRSTAETITKKQSQDARHRRLTQDEAMELSSNLLEPENMRSEIQAFMYAWDGSIQFQGEGPMSK